MNQGVLFLCADEPVQAVPDSDAPEEWRNIRWEGESFKVSSLGRVQAWSSREHRWRIRPQHDTSDGYLMISLSPTYERPHATTVRTHRLIAEGFCEKREGADLVNHIDGNKKNNRAENLEWVTHSENQLHKHRLAREKARSA